MRCLGLAKRWSLVCFGDTSGLFLDLSPGITPWQGPGARGIEPRLAMCEANALPCCPNAPARVLGTEPRASHWPLVLCCSSACVKASGFGRDRADPPNTGKTPSMTPVPALSMTRAQAAHHHFRMQGHKGSKKWVPRARGTARADRSSFWWPKTPACLLMSNKACRAGRVEGLRACFAREHCTIPQNRLGKAQTPLNAVPA